MKQALIVDPQGTAEDFARSALESYQRTAATSLQDAAALASGADYDAVLIAMPDVPCDGALWAMVERIRRLAPDAAFVMVQTEDGDAAFHARAASIGVTVVTAPLGVKARAQIDEVTAS